MVWHQGDRVDHFGVRQKPDRATPVANPGLLGGFSDGGHALDAALRHIGRYGSETVHAMPPVTEDVDQMGDVGDFLFDERR